ncbi:TonB-dependent receptor [Solimonas marina]|uniref:TonB-dependent receptor n=1 Tax=Solimonas marina TaxID=2714601 RepID=A0A970BAX1_9GAMM|nr:TonB-dependent receptor [Solimonas marina]NKF23811.1 TonB-dependent receptor [Solimonas marina]
MIKKPIHWARLSPVAAGAMLFAAGSAPLYAQDAAPAADGELSTIPVPQEAPATPATEAPTDNGLAEVVVTAQKKKQNLQNVPLSVGVISADTLAESASFDAGSIEDFVANVQIDVDPQAPVIGIRGFSTETDNVGFEPSVGIVIDDLAIGRPEFVPDGMFDIDRVEVLRGSQGTLFGKNTIAGVINFVTTEPKDDFSGNVMLTGADPLQRRAEAAVNVPIIDGLLAGRVSGVYWKKLGDVENSTLGRKENSFSQRAGRAKLLFTPGDKWRISLSGQLSDTSVDYPNWQLYDASPNALAYAQEYDPSTEDNGTDSHTTENTPGYVDRHSHLLRGLVSYDAGDFWGLRDVNYTTIVGHAGFSIRSYFDIDTSAADIVNTRFNVDYQQNSVEFRPNGRADSLFGLGGDVDWTLGLFAFASDLDSHLDTLAGSDLIDFALSSAGLDALGIPSGTLGPILDLLPHLSVPIDDELLRGFAQTSRSYAVFGQMTWKLTDKLSTIAGFRFGWEKKEADFDTESVGPGLVALVVGADTFQAHRKRNEQDISPKGGLQYQWTPDVMTFATYTRGFKGGGFNATADTADNLTFSPEKAASWELGIKSRLFHNSMTFNATLYRTDVDNLQTVDNQGTSFTIGNAAKARLQGIEVESQWRAPWRWLSVVTSLAYGSAEYQKYTNAPAAQEDGDAETQDLSGRTLAHAPKFSGTLSPIVTTPLPFTSSMMLKLAADLSYRSGQYSSVDLDSHSHQDGYLLVGGRIVVLPESDRWAVIFSGTNLTNKHALDLVFDHAVFHDSYVAQQIPLRSLAISAQYNW